MDKDAREVLREHLLLPKTFTIYESKDLKKGFVVNTDREHFIDWVDKRSSINTIWDYTLRMIEQYFNLYTRDKQVIKYYLEK